MREIILLECIHGYEFSLMDQEIHYVHLTGPFPNLEEVQPLFQAIRENRSQAIQYLVERDKPVDIAGHLWSAAEKAQNSANRAEEIGDQRLADAEWKRAIRLFAAAAETAGAVEPFIPWTAWKATYTAKISNTVEHPNILKQRDQQQKMDK